MGARLKFFICLVVVIAASSSVGLKIDKTFAARGGGVECTDASSPGINDEEFFPYRFLCGGAADAYNNVYLQGFNGSPNGSAVEVPGGADYTVVPGDSNLDILTGFTTRAFARSGAGGTASKNIYVYTTIDIENKMVENIEFLSGSDSAGGGTIVERKYDACPGAPILAPPWYPGHPEAPNDPDGKFPRGTSIEGAYTTTPGAVNSDTRIINPLNPVEAAVVGPNNASPYTDGGVSSENAKVDCGEQGRMLVWKLNNLPNNFNQKDPRFHFRIKLSETIPGGSDGLFCLRTNIAVQYDGDSYPQALTRIAKKSQRQCYKVVKRTVQGTIRSSTEYATGKNLEGIQVTYNRNCDLATSANQTAPATDANGFYEFDTTVGQNTCLSVPGSTSTGGTSYNSPSPGSYQGPSVNNCNSQPCGGFNFIYNPIPATPAISKSSSPGSSDVKPGDRIDYTMTVTNPRDANISGVQIQDWIPLNMRPDNVTVDSISLTTNDGPDSLPGTERPSWWNVAVNMACPAFSFPFSYGDGRGLLDLTGTPTTIKNSSYSCSTTSGGQHDPPRVSFNFDGRMPAYSTLTLKWHGYVKDAEDVGVYASAAGFYCQWWQYYNWGYGNYGANYTDDGVLSGCSNKTSGIQAVTNWALVQTNNNPGTANISNTTYHPIPGNISCVAKVATAEYDPAGTGGGTACSSEVLGGVPYQSYLWSERPELPSFNETVIQIRPFPDQTAGPIEYYVRDQATTGLSPNLAPQVGGYGPDANHLYSLVEPAPGGTVYWGLNANCRQRWPENNCATAGDPIGGFDTPEYHFRANFNNNNNLPYGSVITNNSRVCWREYWRPPALIGGYPENCRDSNSISYRRVKVDQPFYDTALGGVHSGGGIGDSTAGPCVPEGPGASDSLKNNPGTGKGWFMVSTTGPASGLSGISSLLPDFTKSGADPQCRPDLAKRAESLLSRPSLGYNGPTRANFSGSDETVPGLGNNQIMQSQSGQRFVLGSNSAVNGSGFSNGSVGSSTNTLITKRWTLYVEGDLYIAGNVQYQDTAGKKLGESPSLGVIVTGNIYVDPSVTRLDGYYYAQGETVGATATDGVINTCAAQITGHPQAPANTIKTLSRGYKRDNPTDPVIAPEFGYTVSQCGARLRVNGVMFARSFRFNRVPVDGSGDGKQSEEIAYSNRLILSTPPAFSDLAAQFIRTNYQGESRPRY